MTGTCGTRRGLAWGQCSGGKGMEVEQLPKSPWACSSPRPYSPVSLCAVGSPTGVGGRGGRPPCSEPGRRRGAGAGPPWPWGAGTVPRGCPCPAGESGCAHGGSCPRLPDAPLRWLCLTTLCWRVGGSPEEPHPTPPPGTVPCYSQAEGTPQRGDDHRGTNLSPGSLTVLGGSGCSRPETALAWLPDVFSMRPQPRHGRIRTTRPLSPPQLCITDGSSPPGLFGRKHPGVGEGDGGAACPSSRHPGTAWWDVAGASALLPGHVAAAASGSAAPGELPGPSLPGAEKHEKAEVFPRPAAQTRKGEGKEGRGSWNVRLSPAPPRREGDAP